MGKSYFNTIPHCNNIYFVSSTERGLSGNATISVFCPLPSLGRVFPVDLGSCTLTKQAVITVLNSKPLTMCWDQNWFVLH